ncbi:uncharacterized protein LOC129770871 [Toxorhynchites rutilus septentrionalis]|uniref:uncharacterized protein LOC129770871 n=1 Tax=Toxorhynchites rutilus septentrionalis TaxID=329112 RepID=UPI00247B241B|nr:uncharacterized protein LOC129770871 [Toxorhynchites rutilus septentrionalis]
MVTNNYGGKFPKTVALSWVLTVACCCLLLILSESSASPTAPSARVARDNPECNCYHSFDPWCGTNGRNYLNKCVLKCGMRFIKGLGIAHRGFCPGTDPYDVQGDWDADRPFYGNGSG